MDEIGHEEYEEGNGSPNQSATTACADSLVGHIVLHIEDAQDACQEHHGEAEDQHPGIEQGVETM